jgi:ethanolamine utilization protein EutA
MADNRELLSVGIDIGTTTTQIVFSNLTLVDVSRSNQIPRISITDRRVLYQSNIVFTPLLDQDTIDVNSMAEIIRREYAAAGVLPNQVETGAVIITGETAKKKNADQILTAVAGLAGDFVVTVAGPHVESMIAGRGSGAAEYSRQHFTTVTNVDIGGGSANSAVFKQGNLAATAAMNYGGRILVIEHASGRIKVIAAPAQAILDDLGLNLHIGDQPTLADLRRITDAMAQVTVDLIEGRTSRLSQKLYLTEPSPVSGKGRPLMLSGGIGYYYYCPIPLHSLSDVTIHDDIGPLLAESLRTNAEIQAYTVAPPSETMRATVLGASSQLVTLSGSTIWAEREVLPLRNVPVIHPALEEAGFQPDRIAAAIRAAVQNWDLNLAEDPFAVALDVKHSLSYPQLVEYASGLSEFARTLPEGRPLVAIIQRDYAQAIGQTLKSMIGSRPLLVIDQVGLEEGDYIDIGLPLMDGRVVPLSVKTLVFYH